MKKTVMIMAVAALALASGCAIGPTPAEKAWAAKADQDLADHQKFNDERMQLILHHPGYHYESDPDGSYDVYSVGGTVYVEPHNVLVKDQ